MPAHTVLVTGATGYIARHIIRQLLDAGHSVVGSVRDLASEEPLRASIAAHLGDPAAIGRLRVIALNLDDEAGWAEAMDGIDVLMHTASPVPDGRSEMNESWVGTAIDGTLRAVRAAYAAGVRRIIVTSSVAAVMGAHGHDNGEEFDESDWSDPDRPNLNAYTKSKTLAERALWEWNENEAPDAQVTAVNPSFVMGPPLDADRIPSSLNIVSRLISGQDPALPDISLPFVDVRDVADMHVRAMDLPETAGRRYISTERNLSFLEIAEMLRQDHPDRKIPKRVAPSWLLKTLAFFKPEMRGLAANLGRHDTISNARARKDMGIDFADAGLALRASADYIIDKGLLDKA